jgi:prolyl oligopeptidase
MRDLVCARRMLAAMLCCSPFVSAQIAKPPVGPVRPVTDVYFGQKVDDPYRYLEDQKNPEVVAWMKAQADYTRAVLDSMPGRKRFEAEMQRYMNAAEFTIGDVQLAGKFIFYRKRRQQDNQAALYVRGLSGGEERVLFDPAKLGTADHHFSLDQYAVSLDGAHVAVGVSAGGSEEQTGHILETATAKQLPEEFERFEGGFFGPDGRLYYLQRQKLTPDSPPTDKYLKMREYVHSLGSEVKDDQPVFGYGVVADVKIPETEVGYAEPWFGSLYEVGVVSQFVLSQKEIYIGSADALKKKSGWKKVASYSDNITDVALKGNDLYLVSLKDAPNGKVLRLDARNPDLSKAEVVVPAGSAVITGDYVGADAMKAAADALYIQEAEGGVGKLIRLPYGPGAKPETITLPMDGSADSVVADITQPGALIDVAWWTQPGDYYRYDSASRTMVATGLQPANAIDPKDFASEERKVIARDGTPVLLSIVYKRGLKRDGRNPTLLIGYGAYGDVWKPGFSRRNSLWIEQGGVLAVAHVRGGGEFGEAWHLAGQKLNKPNTWRDFISCAQFLIEDKITSPAKLGIWSASAGGILIGRAITERPDLFAAAVDGVPDSDTLRDEVGANGPPNIPEFGSVKTEEGFQGLYEMSAYAHVTAGTKYPGVLVTAGANDPRVDPWQGAKMAARLQASTASEKPVLLRVNYDAGHGITDTMQQQVSDWTDIFTFVLWQLGEAEFQPAALTTQKAAAAAAR